MADKEKKVAETETAQTAKNDKTPAPAKKKDKVKFTARVAKFFRDYRSEFKKIVWPSKEETTKSTVVVIVSIVGSAVVIGLLDFLFSKGLTLLSHL